MYGLNKKVALTGFIMLLIAFSVSGDWVRPAINVNATVNATFNGSNGYIAKFDGSYLLTNSILYESSSQ